MKLNFTFLAMGILSTQLIMAGTPVIDGTFDGEPVWGAPIGTGDGVAGWNNSNARKLYLTFDNNYVYFGAECRSDNWQQFIFAINTKVGGNGEDPWGRTITYNHSNKPDYLVRGNVDGDFYSQIQVWDGSAWQGTTTNINPDKTEMKGSFNGAREGFIEIRVPKATLGGATSLDVQFIITGNNGGSASGHGCFDAIPNDNNGTDWNAPGNATTVTNYVANVVLPANLGAFAGELRGSTVNLKWNTLTESKLAGFGIERSADARNWQSVGYVTALNNVSGGSYQFSQAKAGTAVSFYRLKVTDKDGSFAHSKLVMIKSETTVNAELIGNPFTSTINVAIHTSGAERIQAELMDMNGKRVSNTIYQHPGGSSVMQIPAQQIGFGTYLLRLNGTETKETLRVVKVQR
jgi:hypothetical protein